MAVRRAIRKEMITYIDDKLKTDAVAQLALTEKDARTLMVRAAAACVGIRESGGNNKGKEVELMQDTVGGVAREPWCMSGVQTIIAYVEHKLGVVSPIPASEHCLSVWQTTPAAQRVQFSPLPGAIAIWRYGKTASGHTGIVEAADDSAFFDYEGNTEGGLNSKGKVIRDGGGFYRVKRSRAGAGNMKLLGFLKPF